MSAPAPSLVAGVDHAPSANANANDPLIEPGDDVLNELPIAV